MAPNTPRSTSKQGSRASTVKQSSKQAHEVARCLGAIGIHVVPDGIELPEDVDQLINTFQKGDRPDPDTPSAKEALKILLKRPMPIVTEAELIRKLGTLMTEVSQDLNEQDGILCQDDRSWQVGCVPCMEDADQDLRQVFKAYYQTSTPKPDLTYGYKFKPFSHEKQIMDTPSIVVSLDICRGTLFPFLTVEWKSTWYGGNMADARNQCARSGSAAVWAMDRLYRLADLTSSAAETCHFSMGIDDTHALWFVHWRHMDEATGSVSWEMDQIYGVVFLNPGALQNLRRMNYHIFEWARNTRLPAIKRCVNMIDPTQPCPRLLRDPPDSDVQSSTTTAISNPLATSSVTADEIIGSESSGPATNNTAEQQSPSKKARLTK